VRLTEAGYTVALPLLAGHGLTPEAMEKSRWTEWTRTRAGLCLVYRSEPTMFSCSALDGWRPGRSGR